MTHHARDPESLQEVTEMTTKQSQETAFTRDVLGRYICNGMDEALASTNPNGQRQPSSNIGREEEALELDLTFFTNRNVVRTVLITAEFFTSLYSRNSPHEVR